MTPEPAPKPHVDPSGPASRRPLLLALAVGVLFCALAVVGYRLMQSTALAHLTQFAGVADRDTQAKQLQWSAAKVGDAFEDGDGARTSESAEALFRLINGARLKLKANSQVRFSRKGAKGALGVQVEMGEAEVQTDGGAVTLASDFGELTLDAGSSIVMRRDGAHLNVDVELGRLQINDRATFAGQSAILELGGILLDIPAPAEPPAVTTSAPTAEAVPSAPVAEALENGDGVANAELVVPAGQSFVVHDPTPPTAIGFGLGQICSGPALVTAGALHTEASGQANLRLPRGATSYEVRCLSNPKVVAAQGTVRVLQDAGTKQLPGFTPTANVVTDGRRYTVLFQHRLPNVTVSWPTAPQAAQYTLQIDGRQIKTSSASHTFSSLSRGNHTVSFSAQSSPLRQSRSTTIEVLYDTQAPTARISEPQGFIPGKAVTLTGQALPGWSVSVGGQPVEVDPQNRFSTTVEGQGAIPIAFSHPTHGQHYYIRRPRAAP